MYRYQLNMAGILWDIRTPVELEPDDKCTPFLTTTESPDIFLDFQLGRPEINGTVLWERSPHVTEFEGKHYAERTLAVKAYPSSCICLDPKDPYHIKGWIYPEKKEDIRTMESLMDVSELEILLSFFGGVSLHSSFIRHKDRGILFTAPSGTGKSTQADLWEKYRGAEILNGDRTMIRKLEEGWTAFGSPFAGSSNIFRNESAPIRTIVVLRQAPVNTLRVMNDSEAFRYLYSEMVIPKWHSEAHKTIISQTVALSSEVPVVLLSCTPDEDAVITLEKYLSEGRETLLDSE